MAFEDLADGWERWNEEPQKVILTYRPDIFNAEEFPAPCLPTIHIRKGKRKRRPGPNTPGPDASWYVTLYLEPDVSMETATYDTREQAQAGANSLAERFAAGDVDYRSLYQVPRPTYLDTLDELTD